MNEETYLAMMTLLIAKNDTAMRAAISIHERLIAIITFLASGRSYENLKF